MRKYKNKKHGSRKVSFNPEIDTSDNPKLRNKPNPIQDLNEQPGGGNEYQKLV